MKFRKQFYLIIFLLQDVLNKLKILHPLPGLILEWRRITNAITKVVFPLQREKHLNPFLGMERIYLTSQSHTATGKGIVKYK